MTAATIIKMSAAKLRVMAVDMEEDMQSYALQAVSSAFENSRSDKEVALAVKKSFDTQFAAVWNCVVGKDFGSHVVYQTRHYIFLSYFDSTYVLLWKSN
jgi:dynein light chain LC8-type